MSAANNAQLKSFVPVSETSHFPIQNLPFGIFSTTSDGCSRAGVAIGDAILDLAELEKRGLISAGPRPVFQGPDLNAFLALGKQTWSSVRLRVSELLRDDNPELRDNIYLRSQVLCCMADATMHMPVHVSGFSDFMLSKEHALNCVDIVGGAQAGEIWPNWHHLPMGYNSRASSVSVSGTPVRRPWGQIKAPGAQSPSYTISRQVDFELEMALIVGKPSIQGSPVRMDQVTEHAFGVVLLNDWSARDIQQWEAQPLGVFNSKNFATSISPWIVMLEALEPFAVKGPEQHPSPLPYLKFKGNGNFDVHLEVRILPTGSERESTICRSNLKTVYWSFGQMLVHQTSAGCNVRSGDLLASGTVSQSGSGGLGCLFEQTRGGRQHIAIDPGVRRLYLEDGDQIKLTGWCQGEQYRIGFGECVGRIFPELPVV